MNVETFSLTTACSQDVIDEVLDFINVQRSSPARNQMAMHANYDPESPHSAQGLILSRRLDGFSIIREDSTITAFSGYYFATGPQMWVGGVRLFTAESVTRFAAPLMLEAQARVLAPHPIIMTINESHSQLFNTIKRLSFRGQNDPNDILNRAVAFYRSCTFYDNAIMFNNTRQLVLSTAPVNINTLDGYVRS